MRGSARAARENLRGHGREDPYGGAPRSRAVASGALQACVLVLWGVDDWIESLGSCHYYRQGGRWTGSHAGTNKLVCCLTFPEQASDIKGFDSGCRRLAQCTGLPSRYHFSTAASYLVGKW